MQFSKKMPLNSGFLDFYCILILRGMFMVFKRKLYSDLLNWKNTSKGKTSLLIEGARRVGKTTLSCEFGKKEYKSFLLIDFLVDLDLFKKVYKKGLRDLDDFFYTLSSVFSTPLYERNTLIIFDEIQAFHSLDKL